MLRRATTASPCCWTCHSQPRVWAWSYPGSIFVVVLGRHAVPVGVVLHARVCEKKVLPQHASMSSTSARTVPISIAQCPTMAHARWTVFVVLAYARRCQCRIQSYCMTGSGLSIVLLIVPSTALHIALHGTLQGPPADPGREGKKEKRAKLKRGRGRHRQECTNSLDRHSNKHTCLRVGAHR